MRKNVKYDGFGKAGKKSPVWSWRCQYPLSRLLFYVMQSQGGIDEHWIGGQLAKTMCRSHGSGRIPLLFVRWIQSRMCWQHRNKSILNTEWVTTNGILKCLLFVNYWFWNQTVHSKVRHISGLNLFRWIHFRDHKIHEKLHLTSKQLAHYCHSTFKPTAYSFLILSNTRSLKYSSKSLVRSFIHHNLIYFHIKNRP